MKVFNGIVFFIILSFSFFTAHGFSMSRGRDLLKAMRRGWTAKFPAIGRQSEQLLVPTGGRVRGFFSAGAMLPQPEMVSEIVTKDVKSLVPLARGFPAPLAKNNKVTAVVNKVWKQAPKKGVSGILENAIEKGAQSADLVELACNLGSERTFYDVYDLIEEAMFYFKPLSSVGKELGSMIQQGDFSFVNFMRIADGLYKRNFRAELEASEKQMSEEDSQILKDLVIEESRLRSLWGALRKAMMYEITSANEYFSVLELLNNYVYELFVHDREVSFFFKDDLDTYYRVEPMELSDDSTVWGQYANRVMEDAITFNGSSVYRLSQDPLSSYHYLPREAQKFFKAAEMGKVSVQGLFEHIANMLKQDQMLWGKGSEVVKKEDAFRYTSSGILGEYGNLKKLLTQAVNLAYANPQGQDQFKFLLLINELLSTYVKYNRNKNTYLRGS